MKVPLVIYGAVVLVIGLGLAVVYFSLAKFLTANARALERNSAAEMPQRREKTQPQPITGAAPQQIEYKATAKAAS